MMEDQALVERLAVLNTYPISKWSYPRILVGIPLERAISYADKVFINFLRIAAYNPAFIDRPYARVDLIRNLMVEDLLASPTYTHLLMLDVDHKHPVDIIQRLARWVVIFPEVRVVSGMNFRRQPPYDPVMGNITGDARPVVTSWVKGLIEEDEVGGASLLVHRSVFEEMEPPWFFNIYDRVMENNWPGEDMGFCKKCRELGIRIHVDTTTSSPHATESLVTEETFRNYMANNPDRFKDIEHA